LYHGVPINSETIAVAFGILVWIIRSIARGLKQISRPALPPVPSQAPLAPPPQPFQAQNPFQPQNPFQAQPPRPQFPGQAPPPSGLRPVQTPPVPLSPAQQQAARRELAQPRQPSAGGPAVPAEASRQDFVRQEQELFASEPAALGVSLTSSAATAAAPNALFGGTDDLVRAIILQEVLGPPLSRRKSPPPPPSC